MAQSGQNADCRAGLETSPRVRAEGEDWLLAGVVDQAGVRWERERGETNCTN